MEEYDWPGNVRELENVIERAIIFSSGSSLTVDNLIPKEHKPTHDRYRLKSENTGLSLKSGEKFLIQRALQEADGNITKAAKTLGITRATMYRKIKAYGI